jgi:hypothetical protein
MFPSLQRLYGRAATGPQASGASNAAGVPNMKSFTVLRAAAFRGLKPQLFDAVNMLELVDATKRRYEFLKCPDLEKPSESFDFQVGKLRAGNRVIKIEQFLVAYVGTQATSLGAAARTSSDDADLFLEDFTLWAKGEFGLDTTPLFAPAYHGQVEFVLETDRLSNRLEELNELGKAITNIIQGYGLKECPQFGLSAFTLHFDTIDLAMIKPIPTAFAIERRVGARYSENKYFSQAPLKTGDHKAILERFEALLLK